jgi:hypothetical protein
MLFFPGVFLLLYGELTRLVWRRVLKRDINSIPAGIGRGNVLGARIVIRASRVLGPLLLVGAAVLAVLWSN